MSIIELREKLHDYIETADESHLSAIFTLVENDMPENHNSVFDEETMKMLYKRRDDDRKGLTEWYTAEESINRILQHKK